MLSDEVVPLERLYKDPIQTGIEEGGEKMKTRVHRKREEIVKEFEDRFKQDFGSRALSLSTLLEVLLDIRELLEVKT